MRRLKIIIKECPIWLENNNIAELEIDGKILPVVKDEDDNVLITATNLENWKTSKEMDIKYLIKGNKFYIYESTGYSPNESKKVKKSLVEIEDIVEIENPYSPMIPILSTPRSFMMLVPGDQAIEIANTIGEKYNREFSKVKNRLPIHLGVIFFDKHQPLFSAIDAGRRLLKQDFQLEKAKIIKKEKLNIFEDDQDSKCSPLPDYFTKNTKHFDIYTKLKLSVNLNKILCWYVSTLMGDGKTKDIWYPYCELKSSNSLVHVDDLNEGQEINFIPSKFTWIMLDTSARRFDVSKNTNYLDKLFELTDLWRRIQKLAKKEKNPLSETQLRAIVDLIKYKSESWNQNSDEFKKLANSIVSKENLLNITLEDITSGNLAECYDLFKHVLKFPLI